MSSAEKITDHKKIREWAEARGGRPSVVRATHGDDKGRGKGGVLRFDFGEPEDSLEEISWDEFFQIFEDSKLALLEQDETKDGKQSRFFKFVAR